MMFSYDVQSTIPLSSTPLTSTNDPCTKDSSKNRRYALCDRSSLDLPNRYKNDFCVGAIRDPTNYEEAAMLEWYLAMSEDLATLESTGTWDLVPFSPRKIPITCKRVYKVKTNSDGSMERYKAQLIARGFQQAHGRDYDETFAHVAHMISICTFIIAIAAWSWSISQRDVKNAFLYGDLHDEVYKQPPLGVEAPSGHVFVFEGSIWVQTSPMCLVWSNSVL
jgi:hypothetical protein